MQSFITYTIVVIRESVRIALMIAIFNDLEVKSGGILNIYVRALVTEMVWITLDPEFGKHARKTAKIIRAL